MKQRTLITGGVAVAAAAALGIAGTVVAQAQETGDEALGEVIDEILDDDRLTDSQVGVVVADAATGETLYERGADQRIIPASNQKLTTVAAAFELLGADHAFETSAVTDAETADGVVDGDVYLRGSGDPTLREDDLQILAADMAESGVTAVDGDLVGDDTVFDDEVHGPEWAWGDLQYAFAAEVSGLTVAAGDDLMSGAVSVEVTPGAEGDPAQIGLEPAGDYVTIVNDTETIGEGTETEIVVDRDEHSNEITVSGTVAADDEGTVNTRSVIDPAAMTTEVFADALESQGITVNGDVRTGDEAPQDAENLSSHESMPLSELAVELMKPSNNLHAEALMKALGADATGDGSFAAGKDAVYAAIEKYGVDTEPIRQVDGSGLSRFDQVSPGMITDLLVGVRDADWFDAYYEALPVACTDDESTLVDRMCDTPAEGNVHAKTGTVTSVSSLSGYATDADDRDLVFSVLVNDHLADSVKDIEDQIGAAVAGHGESSTEGDITTYGNVRQIEPEEIDAEHAGLECTWVEPAIC